MGNFMAAAGDRQRGDFLTATGAILLTVDTQDRGDSKWHDDQVIQVADNQDEVGDQINWAQGIRDDGGGHQLGVPGSARVAGSQIQRERVAFQGQSTVPELIN